MVAAVVLAMLVLLGWLLAKAGVFRAFGRAAPARKIDTSTRSIGGLPDLPAAMGFRPVFRYELLPALRALGVVAPDSDAGEIDALLGSATGTVADRRVLVYATPGSNRAGRGGAVTGAVTAIGTDLPAVDIRPRGLPAPEVRGRAMEPVVTGVAEFDDAYAVTTADREAAAALLDTGMRHFLLALVRPWTFAVGGDYVGVRAVDLDQAGVERFLEALTRFAERVPPELRRRHPPAPAG